MLLVVFDSAQEWHRSILCRPHEECMRLAAVHVLGHIQHNKVIERFHLERDPPGMSLSWLANNELDLHIAGWHARVWIQWQSMCRVRAADQMASLVSAVDAKDAHKDVDGGKCVRICMWEGGLILAVRSPWHMLLIRIEDVDDELGDGSNETCDQNQRQDDGDGWMGPKAVLNNLLMKPAIMRSGWVHIDDALRLRFRSLDELDAEEENKVLSDLGLRFHLDFLVLRERVAVNVA